MTLTKEHSERIDIEATHIYPKDMIDRHIARYTWAVDTIKERFGRVARIVDVACGTGYGSKMLLSVSNRVLGLDKDRSTIELNTYRYNAGGLIDFNIFNADSDCKYLFEFTPNVIVSIESIEHFKYPKYFLESCAKALCNRGMLLLSTPKASLNGTKTSEHHIKEFTATETLAMLEEAGFSSITYYDVMPGFLFFSAFKEVK